MKIKKITAFVTIAIIAVLAISSAYGYWVSKVEAECSLSFTRQAQVVLVSPVPPAAPASDVVVEEGTEDEVAEDGEAIEGNEDTVSGEESGNVKDAAADENTDPENDLSEEPAENSDDYTGNEGYTETESQDSGDIAESIGI